MHHLLRARGAARLAENAYRSATGVASTHIGSAARSSAGSTSTAWRRHNSSSASGGGKQDAPTDSAPPQATPAPAPASAKEAVPPTPTSRPSPPRSEAPSQPTPSKAQGAESRPTAAAMEATSQDLASKPKAELKKATVLEAKSKPSPKTANPEAAKESAHRSVSETSPAQRAPPPAAAAAAAPTVAAESSSQTAQVKLEDLAEAAAETSPLPNPAAVEAKGKARKTKSLQELAEDYEDDEFLPSEIKEALAEMEKGLEEEDGAAQFGETKASEAEMEQVAEFIEKHTVPDPRRPNTPEFSGSSDPSPLPSLESLGDNFTEPEYAAALVHGRSIHKPYYHPKTHDIPVAFIHFASHSTYSLTLFAHFASHAASALGIPISGIVSLPKRRRLWTVIKGPFVHKKSQENFERVTHRRAIKVYDADTGVVDLLIGYLRKHVKGGVGMRIVRWDRREVGLGAKMLEGAKAKSSGDKVREMGERIVKTEQDAGKDAAAEVQA